MNGILFGVKFSEWERINFWTFMVSNPGLQIDSSPRYNILTYLISEGVLQVCAEKFQAGPTSPK